MESLGFSIYKTVSSENSDSFTFPFPVLMLFIFFFCYVMYMAEFQVDQKTERAPLYGDILKSPVLFCYFS